VFDIAKAEAEAMIEPHGIGNDLRREAVTARVWTSGAHGCPICRILFAKTSSCIETPCDGLRKLFPKVWHNFAGEEFHVLHRQMMRHIAKLERRQQNAAVEAFDPLPQFL